MKTRCRCRGFSLIEILVVVVIISIIVSTAVLSLNLLGDDRDLQTEARRIASLIEVAEDEAMMQGREFGLELMQTSYRFVEYDPFANQWADFLADDTFRMRQLPEDVEFELFLEEKRVVLRPDPAAFDDVDDGGSGRIKASYAPHLLIFSSGDVTPFELHITRRVADQAVVLRGDFAGAIEIASDDDEDF